MILTFAALRSGTLRELGYRVIEASDGHGALRLLDADRAIELLFTDVGLPGGMNGRQLATEAQTAKGGIESAVHQRLRPKRGSFTTVGLIPGSS